MDDIFQNALFNKTMIPTYSKLADLSATRHKLIGSNIANVNTTGYQKKEIDFDKELKKAITKPKLTGVTTDPRHIPLHNSNDAPPKIISTKKTDNSTGVNSVDIDEEMADLAQNQIVFNFGADMLQRNFKGLKAAINGHD
jgi:flagellar basal-body rod protein FlgB